MVTNTPVGVLAAIVILPSCLDFTVVHRVSGQTSTCHDNGRNHFLTADCGCTAGSVPSTPGVWYDYRLTSKLRDEAPAAYKDIRAVLKAQRELVKVVRTLRPVLNYKGI
jgi:hypothetical protein